MAKYTLGNKLNTVVKSLHRKYKKRCIEHVCGRNRSVFIMPGGYVVKLPRNHNGITDNDWEGSVSNNELSYGNDDYVQYARTRMHYITVGEDLIPILFMEYVEYTNEDNLPDWVNSVDCGQVGYTKSGRLVAFDYGIR